MNFAFFEYYLSAMLLVSAMVGMGATLTIGEFVRVVHRPNGVLAVLVAQIAVSPLLALSLSWMMGLPPGVSFGLLLVAALPGGLFSNLLTFLGKGNVALSIAATGLSTLLCLFTTTLVLQIYGAARIADGVTMPADLIVFEIACFLLFPLFAGMAVHRWWPSASPQISQISIRFSTLCLLVFVAGALLSGRLRVASYGWTVPIALCLFGSISVWIAIGVGTIFRLSGEDRFTVAIEVVVRNGNLGLLLKAAIFPAVSGEVDPIGDGVLFVVLFYAGLSLVLGLIEVFTKRMGGGVSYR